MNIDQIFLTISSIVSRKLSIPDTKIRIKKYLDHLQANDDINNSLVVGTHLIHVGIKMSTATDYRFKIYFDDDL